MASDSDRPFDWRRPPEPRWLARAPWAQFALFGAFVLFIALPFYTSFPPIWAAVGAMLVAVVIMVFSGPKWPRYGTSADEAGDEHTGT
jgi:hypothetical protein